MIEAKNLRKTFGTHTAVDGVFDLTRAESGQQRQIRNELGVNTNLDSFGGQPLADHRQQLLDTQIDVGTVEGHEAKARPSHQQID